MDYEHFTSPITNDSLIPRAVVLREILRTAPSTAWRNELNSVAGWPTPVRIGSRVFYRRSEVERYMADLPAAPRGARANAQQQRALSAARNATGASNKVLTPLSRRSPSPTQNAGENTTTGRIPPAVSQ
jgi:predicted DNA-binding transcriptional regulator AlpA